MSQRVLVLGDDAKAFLGVVRSLGRQGLAVHAAPGDFASPALKSRYLAAVHRLPSYWLGAEAWSDAVREIVEHERIGLVIPTSDASLLMLMRHARTLGRERLALPNEEAAAIFTDKAATRRLAFECGVPVCSGRPIIVDDTPAELVRCFGLPLVLKPRHSWEPGMIEGKRQAIIVRSVKALERALIRGLAEQWIVESFFAGAGIGLSVLAKQGEIQAAIQHRRLQQENETGPSTRRITERVTPRLLAWSRDMAQATRLTGVAMFEYRWNPASDEHVLLEVNPRFWGSLQLALAAGIDFPAMLHGQRAGGPVQTGQSYVTGLIKSDLSGEYERLSAELTQSGSVGAHIRAGATALAFLIRLSRKSAFDSWAEDDPEPFFEERRLLIARAAAAAAKRIPQPALLRSIRVRRRLRRLAARGDRIRLLIVGNANVCRSPFAEGLLRAQVSAQQTAIEIESAGTLPVEDRAPPQEAMAAAAQFGVDLSRHRSRSLTLGALLSASAVIVFDHVTAERLRTSQPDIGAAVVRLPDLIDARDIVDPSGGGIGGVLGEFERISLSVTALASALLQYLPLL